MPDVHGMSFGWMVRVWSGSGCPCWPRRKQGGSVAQVGIAC